MTSYYVLVKSDSTYESYEQLNHVALLDKGSDLVIGKLNHTDTITYDKEVSIGNLLVNLDLDQVQAIIVNISVYDFINEDVKIYDEWNNDYELETFVGKYTTKSGDRVVAFGKYGYDG